MITESPREVLDRLLRDNCYQKEFSSVLAQIRNTSSVLRALLEKIEEEKIELMSSELLEEFFNIDKYDKECMPPLGYGAFPQIGKPRIIVISLKIMEWSTVPEIEFGLAHELGHFIAYPEAPSCRYGELKLNPFPYRILLRCSFIEIRADEEALKILLDIHGGIENWRIDNYFGRKNLKELISYRIELNKLDRDICINESTCPCYAARQQSRERIKEIIT